MAKTPIKDLLPDFQAEYDQLMKEQKQLQERLAEVTFKTQALWQVINAYTIKKTAKQQMDEDLAQFQYPKEGTWKEKIHYAIKWLRTRPLPDADRGYTANEISDFINNTEQTPHNSKTFDMVTQVCSAMTTDGELEVKDKAGRKNMYSIKELYQD